MASQATNGGFLQLSVKHRPRLLIAMMRALRSDATKVSFEGYLSGTDLIKLKDVSFEGTSVLKRGTLSPRLDFVILPLNEGSCPSIENAIISKISFKNGQGIIHVQIEQNGELVFAAYDGFQHSGVKASMVPPGLLAELVEKRILQAAFFAP